MGKGALAPPPLWKCCKIFLCIAKRSVDDYYLCIIFTTCRLLGVCPQIPTGALSLDPAGGLLSPDPNLPTPGKNPVGAHDDRYDNNIGYFKIKTSIAKIAYENDLDRAQWSEKKRRSSNTINRVCEQGGW